MNRNFSHTVKVENVSLVWEQGVKGDRSVLHAKGCQHTKKRFSRGVEYILAVADFDLSGVQADDHYHVAPCAR